MHRQIIVAALLVFTTFTISSGWANADSDEQGGIPAYNAGPPAQGTKLPPIVPKEQLWGPNFEHPYQLHAYELAAKIPSVLYQQPCYCYCDRMGHNSLRSCYESDHAAHCGACLKELYYSYAMRKKGKTARQIRKEIIAGQWQHINLETAASIK
jgi:hypothetical protein